MAISREQVVQSAEKLVSRGKIEAAIREYRKVLAENPNDANTLNRVGDLYARIQRIDEAVDLFNQIAAQYTKEGFFVKAIAIYKKIIKLNPTHLEVYERLAELYHKQGLINEARTQYQVLADYYSKHENSTSAIAMYQKMAEVEPDNPTYHVKLAELYHQQQLTEKAMGEYRTIAELMLGVGHAQEAAQVYERALLVDATNIPFITDAVLKLREAGHNAAAARFLAAAIERNPLAERVARLVGVDDGGGVATADLADVTDAGDPGDAGDITAAAEASWGGMPRDAEPEADSTVDMGWTSEGLAMPSADLYDSQPLSIPGIPEMPEIPVDFAAAPPAVWPAPTPPATPARPPASPAPEDNEEFELDLDEVFALDMESEDEPASLVKPPADMLGEAPRRPAWALGGDDSTVTAAPEPEIASGTAEDFELPGIELEEEAPAWEVEIEPEIEPQIQPVTRQELRPIPGRPIEPSEPDEPEIELDLAGDLDFDALPTFLPEPWPPTEDPFAAAAAPSPGPDVPEVDLELPTPGSRLDFGDELDLQPLPDLESLPAPPMSPMSPPPPPAAPSSPSAPSALQFDPDLLERTAAELHPQILHQREEDLVTEAEVLAKYGLEEKALDRLREALKVNPRHLPAHALAIQLQLDKGRHARVVELANQMAKAAAQVADREPWLKVRRRLLNAGYRLDGDQVLTGPTPAAPLATPPPASPPKTARGVDDLLRGLLGKESPKRPAARRDPISPPPRPEPEPPMSAPPLPPPISPPAPVVSAASMVPPVAIEPAPPPPVPPAAVVPPASVIPAPGQTFNLLEIGEMVENEDMDGIDFPLTGYPPSVAIPPPPPPRPSAAAASLDDTGMSWLDEAEAGREKQGAAGGQLFADEDDFFDLAGELEQELSREEGLRGSDLLVQPAEQSLEQIVEGFKKGVAENLSPTDFDTHFNLGIAYREMGLLDEAIGEFQLASKSPALLVACCSMLGLCFLDKGLPALALKWYRRGLESPNVSEDDSLGLLYDMGNVYDSQGDTDTAYKTFVEIYGINTNYRDVVARIEELGRGR